MNENNWNIHISKTPTTDEDRTRVLRLRYECDNDKSVVSDCVFIGSNVVSVILDIYEFELLSFPLWKR